ncbi:uncharacterized protein LOC119079873 isoform X2 [Bradysia coprophila]|uniref:uncharacterized protein LOC119079873 isoform X2 n=1 Tax=Bradysia coprophila TaxID=38358 RepID=UPI00187DC672|nr:uncharacterized protein LOC119079873 isoform X2 [Bradysia coprophila]
MSDAITGGPSSSMSPDEEVAMKRIASIENQKLINKIKVLGMQMEGMDNKEKAKYSGQFGGLSKSLGKLRRILRQKMPNTSWQWTIYVSLALLIVIYAFFGYKLYKSLTEKERKREEKLKAKQSKKKK